MNAFEPVCILGIGSPYGDDQAGWLTVEALQTMTMPIEGEYVIERLDRPGASLMAYFENHPWVILIDAMRSGAPVGTTRHFEQQAWSAYGCGLSSHGFGVLDTLNLARVLGSLPPRLSLYGIEIGEIEPDRETSLAVRTAARQLAAIIVDELPRQFGQGLAVQCSSGQED